ncbi:MAG: M48 family metalloprotease [bacterium]|nr:M48 family metalloprotease [bacterium]
MTVVVVVAAAGAALALVAAFGVLASGWIVGRLAGARPPEGVESERLEVCVEALCLAAGLPVPRLAVIDDEAASALAYGRGPRTATVAVTTGLLRSLSPVELEGTLAHLLARVADGTARRDTRLASAALLGGPPGTAWVSRRLDGSRVVAADVAAARLTRFPPGIAGALGHMGEAAAPLRRRSPAIRHLWMHEARGPGGERIGLEDRVTVLGEL